MTDVPTLPVTHPLLERGLELVRRHGKAAFAYLAAFGLSKGIVVFGPIFLAAVFSPDVYGAVELALSSGLFLATIATGPITSAVPRLHLARTPILIDDVTAAMMAAASAACLVAAAVNVGMHGSATVSLCLLATVPAIAQGAIYIHMMVASHRSRAVIAGSLATLIVTATALLAVVVPNVTIHHLLVAYAFIAVGLSLAAAVVFVRTVRPQFSARARKAITIGVPLVSYGLVAVWISASGRVYLATFLSIETVAVYSFDFRLAAMALLPHQLISAALFARVYRLRTRSFDRLWPAVTAMSAGIGLTVYMALPWLIGHSSPKALGPHGPVVAQILFPLVMGQVLVWTISSAVFLRINRAGLASTAGFAAAAVAVVIGFVFAILAYSGTLTLTSAALLLMLQEAGHAAVLLAILWRHKLAMPRMLATVAAVVCGAVLLHYLKL